MKKFTYLILSSLAPFYIWAQVNSTFTYQDSISCASAMPFVDFSNSFGGSGNFLYSVNAGNELVKNGTGSTFGWTRSANRNTYNIYGVSGSYRLHNSSSPRQWHYAYQEIDLLQKGYTAQYLESHPTFNVQAMIYTFYHPTAGKGLGKVTWYFFDKFNNLIKSHVWAPNSTSKTWISYQEEVNDFSAPVYKVRVTMQLYKYSRYAIAKIDNISCYPGDFFSDGKISVKPGEGQATVVDTKSIDSRKAFSYNIRNQYDTLNFLNQMRDTTLCSGDTLRYSQSAQNRSKFNAIQFDGVNDWILIEHGGAKVKSSDYSMFSWIKTTASNEVLFSQQNGSKPNFNFGIHSTGVLGYGDSSAFVSSGTTVNNDQWHHIGYTYDNLVDSVHFYIDGLWVQSAKMNMSINDSLLFLGCEIIGGVRGRFYSGKMDDFSLWHRKLTSTEIAQLLLKPAYQHPEKFHLAVGYGFNAHCNINMVYNHRANFQGLFYDGALQGNGPDYISNSIANFNDSIFTSKWNTNLGEEFIGDTFFLRATKTTMVYHELFNSSISYIDSSMVNVNGSFDLGSNRTEYFCNPNDSLLLTAGVAQSYLWSTSDTTREIAVQQSGIYYCQTYESGCYFSDTVTVVIEKKSAARINLKRIVDAAQCIGTMVSFSIDSLPVPAIEFNGNDWLEVNSLRNDIAGKDRSFFTWFNSVNSSSQYVFSINDSVGGNKYHFGSTGGKITIWTKGIGHNVGITNICDGKWHHIGYTYNDSTMDVKLYVDGKEEVNFNQDLSCSIFDWYSIGTALYGIITPNQFFNGKLADVNVWSVVLDTSDVALLKKEPIDSTNTMFNDLIAQYLFLDDCDFNEIITDRSNYKNDAVQYKLTKPEPAIKYLVDEYIPKYQNTAGYSISWSAGPKLLSDSNSLSVNIKDTLKIVLKIERNFNLWLDTFNISRLGAKIDLGSDTTHCSNKNIRLDAGKGYLYYQWSDSSHKDSLSIAQSGKYWVSVAHQGCVSSDTVNITMYTYVPLELGGDTAICDNSGFRLNAGNSYSSYLWQDSSSGVLMTPFSDNNYWVSVRDTNNCVQNDSINVEVFIAPSVNLGSDTNLCNEGQYILNPYVRNTSYISNYEWFNGSNAPLHVINLSQLPLGIANYWLTITDGNGCMDVDSIAIEIQNCIVGINENDKPNLELSVYPVPTKDILNLEFIMEQKGDFEWQIMDVQGRIFMSEKLTLEQGVQKRQLQVSNLSKGTYFIQVLTTNYRNVKTFVKN